jgi:hypothetical protein
MHAPDDGPDAYSSCRCKCDACKPDTTLGIHDPTPANCIDGEVAEPMELAERNVARVSAEHQHFDARDLDPYLYLASVKSRLADHQPMTLGDAWAWELCDKRQQEVELEQLIAAHGGREAFDRAHGNFDEDEEAQLG